MPTDTLELVDLLMDAGRMDELQFVTEYPHPVLLPEVIRSGLLERSRGSGGAGTLQLQGRRSGESRGLQHSRILVVRKERFTGRTERFDRDDSLATWISIGRKAKSEVMINDFSVSTDHARLRRNGRHYEIEDLSSLNGTCIGGAPIPASQPTTLPSGQMLRIGRVELRFLLPADLFRFLKGALDAERS